MIPGKGIEGRKSPATFVLLLLDATDALSLSLDASSNLCPPVGHNAYAKLGGRSSVRDSVR